jgi:hypothetical protein
MVVKFKRALKRVGKWISPYLHIMQAASLERVGRTGI